MKIEIDGKTINEHKSVKYLGILIDCHLNWKEHIQQLSKKISRGIGVLCKLGIMLMSKFWFNFIMPLFSFFFILLYSLG